MPLDVDFFWWSAFALISSSAWQILWMFILVEHSPNKRESTDCGVLARLSWILLNWRSQTQTADRSRYKLRITTSYNHSAAAKNAVTRIWEGDGMEHRHTTSNKSQRETLATKTECNDNGNIENRQYQYPMYRIQNYPIIFFDVSLTAQLPTTFSAWHVTNTEDLAHELIGTCAGRLQNYQILTQGRNQQYYVRWLKRW